jgi:hypothetical protein
MPRYWRQNISLLQRLACTISTALPCIYRGLWAYKVLISLILYVSIANQDHGRRLAAPSNTPGSTIHSYHKRLRYTNIHNHTSRRSLSRTSHVVLCSGILLNPTYSRTKPLNKRSSPPIQHIPTNSITSKPISLPLGLAPRNLGHLSPKMCETKLMASWCSRWASQRRTWHYSPS